MLLYLECPCTSFPRSFARDYKETYRYPPLSTIYGFLLSLVGEVDLAAHLGVNLAIGLIGNEPPISRIVRKQRHHKFSRAHLGSYPTSKFSKPNHHELLTDLQVAVQIDSSEESASVTLEERVAIALSTPKQITRFGGLSLGESWALVNGIRPYRETDGTIRWLVVDNRGLISLPVWIDRNTGRGTFCRFTLGDLVEGCWVNIQAPEEKAKAIRSKQPKRSKN
ncbi:MAG TPA: CRISPR-associated protein Cas5 [Coleofasciculaceae cyanobacterium]|jgi:CRISPR-associated protein Cas5t